MIFAQIQPGRSFIGCLDLQCELVTSIAAVCKDKSIDCAFVSGYGYLEDPVFVRYSRGEKGYTAPAVDEGVFVCQVLGSVSAGEDDRPNVTLFLNGAVSERGRSRSVSGQIVEARVRQFEFLLTTVDNVVLKRLKEKQTGMHLWLQMLPAGFGGGVVDAPQLSAAMAGALASERDDSIDDEPNLKEGDWLNHPRLGMCRVLLYDGEERIKVRLASGRIAELMMSLFHLTSEGVRDGSRVYAVEVRKRK
jgi:predicted DNA-binding protein with PD1-like motif